MKEIIIQQLQERIGLSEEQATQAAAVVMELIEKHGGDLLGNVSGALGGDLGGAIGGLFGKD